MTAFHEFSCWDGECESQWVVPVGELSLRKWKDDCDDWRHEVRVCGKVVGLIDAETYKKLYENIAGLAWAEVMRGVR